MNSTPHRILGLLNEDEYLSGEALGKRLGISRMAVSKAVRRLAESGVDITSVVGKGYRLDRAVQLLDRGAIEANLNDQWGASVGLHLLESVSSTSDYLLDAHPFGRADGMVCLSERQEAGRGRRGRYWVSTPYRNIIMSIAWQFHNGLADLAGLGVAAGVCIARTLHELGYDTDIGLKWPNDIVWRDRKLGGLLIDVRGEHYGPCVAVLGLGINLSLSDDDAADVDQPFATLDSIHGKSLDRNQLTISLINGLLKTFKNYPDTGFAPWQELWNEFDRYKGRPVVVQHGEQKIFGQAAGINEQGALILSSDDGQLQTFYSGEVSLRLA